MALWVPEEGQRILTGWLEKMGARSAKTVRQGQFHITLLFLGDVEASRVPSVVQALEEAVKGIPPFALDVEGSGGFPSREAARVWFFTLSSPPPELYRLAEAVRTRLSRLGFRDDKPFHPHVTFARVKGRPRPVPQHPGGRYRWPVQEVVLVKSVLTPRGPQYTPLHTVPLGR